MSNPPFYVHPPNLAENFSELDRRLRVMEYGDPNAVKDVRDALWDLELKFTIELAQIRAVLNESSNVLYENDWDLALYTSNTGNTLASYIQTIVFSYIADYALFTAHQHEEVFHQRPHYNPPAVPAGPNLPALVAPVEPPYVPQTVSDEEVDE